MNGVERFISIEPILNLKMPFPDTLFRNQVTCQDLWFTFRTFFQLFFFDTCGKEHESEIINTS